jgi:hypothetical protein
VNTVLSILVLAAFVLVLGAYALWRRGGSIKQVLLMVLLAVIALLNVAIWTLPDASGEAPASKSLQLSGK